jgi:hypothetical protein
MKLLLLVIICFNMLCEIHVLLVLISYDYFLFLVVIVFFVSVLLSMCIINIRFFSIIMIIIYLILFITYISGIHSDIHPVCNAVLTDLCTIFYVICINADDMKGLRYCTYASFKCKSYLVAVYTSLGSYTSLF